MLNRKHYKAIAEIVKDEKMREQAYGAANLAVLASHLADYFAQDNPWFDRSRFLEACGL